MRIGQTSLVYFVSKVIGSALGFVATIYFARALGAEILGQYALVMALITWLGIGGTVGFSGAISKRISEGEDPDRFAGAGLVVMGSTMTAVAAFVVLFREQVNAYVGAPVAAFVVLLLFVTLFKSFVSASLKGSHLVHVYAVLSTGRQATRAATQIALVAVGFGLAGMLFGYATGYLLTATVGLWILGVRPALPEKHHIVSLFAYAKYAWLGKVRGRTFDTLDIAVLGLFVGQGLIGIYSVAWAIGKFLDIFGSAVSSTLFPEMSSVSANDGPRAVAGLTEDALTYAGLILIPGLVGTVIVGDRLLRMYGETFVAGTEILSVLVVALLVYTYNKQLLNTLNAIDRPDLAFRANGVFIATNVTLNVVLIPLYGWIGAAVATALSAAVGLLVAFQFTRQHVPFAVPTAAIVRQWLAAGGMGLVVFAGRRVEESYQLLQHNLILVSLLVSLGAVSYFLTLFLIAPGFRTTVRRNLPVEGALDRPG
ncbi:MAG: polysaccharide biosynthesis protein [Euryarchaeota archaeon]|nr:polysaccharide biosynthesis protein [Euryarchaeota archaeon]